MRQVKNKDVQNVSPMPRQDPVRAAADYGIDIQMLIANIARTPEERIRRHQIALETFDMLRKAKHV